MIRRNLIPTAKRPGSALVITMVMALALAATGAAFLSLTTTVRKVNESNHTYHALQSALERGTDQAMYAFGKYRTGGFTSFDAAWTKFTATGTLGYSRNFGSVDLGNGRTATLKVTIQNLPFDSTGLDSTGTTIMPYIVAEAYYDGSKTNITEQFSRQIVAILSPTTSDSTTGGLGLTVKGTMNFNGKDANMGFDSYTSAKSSVSGLAAPYGGSNISDKITVATAMTQSTTTDPVDGNASVYGYAYVGGGDAKTAFNGFHIWGSSSDSTYKGSGIDPARVGTGYTGNFTVPTMPSTSLVSSSLGAITGDTTITGSNDPNKPIYYSVSSIKLNGKETITVTGNAVLVMSGDLDLGGQGGIQMYNDSATSSSLKIYTAGDVSLTGNGVANIGSTYTSGSTTVTRTPTDASLLTQSFSIFGTNTTPGGQSVKIAGNGAFSGVVFAPNANATFDGGGSTGVIYGAMTVNTVTVNGKVQFHYDSALTSSATTVVSSYPVAYWIEPKTKKEMSAFGL